LVLRSFFIYFSVDLRDLHSFPTRRSSDLSGASALLSFFGMKNACWLSASHWQGNISSRVFILLRWPWREYVSSIGALPSFLILRSEEHTSELQSRENLVCRLLLEKKKTVL